MARRIALVTIDDPKSRDLNKTFRIREMSADAAERWFIRLVFALANGGLKVPADAMFAGIAGFKATVPVLLVQGLRSLAGMSYTDAEPMLGEMLGCVDFKAPGTETYFPLIGTGMTQVEEVSTLLRLRYEVLEIHLGFTLADALSNLREAPTTEAPSA